MFAIAYFGMVDFAEIGRMTLQEFQIRKKAYLLQKIEREEDIHLQAWANRAIEATRKDGKYQFRKFKDFYDKDKRLRSVLTFAPTEQEKRLLAIARRVRQFEMEREEEFDGE